MEKVLPCLEMEIISGCKKQSLKLQKSVTIGSSASCDIRIQGLQVSALHAKLDLSLSGKWRVRHLSPEHSTLKNGVEIGEAPIGTGDCLQIGSTELHFAASPKELVRSSLSSKNADWDAKLQKLPNIAQAQYPVLLLGPSGSGKDFLAQKIHELSSRRQFKFVSVNCAALNENLVESELFGHRKGSFTGAIADRMGAFETANHGTLFLDEIGDLPLPVQAKLLRALENKEIKAIGSDSNVSVDVRIVAATHKNLNRMAAEGLFRKDLLYRLNVIQVCVPGLKERPEDIADFLDALSQQMRVRISEPALRLLAQHPWPGNVREIKNFLARANSLFPGLLITEDRVPQLLDLDTMTESILPAGAQQKVLSGRDFLKSLEKEMILERLKQNNWNQRRTALELGIPKSTLHDRIRRLGLASPSDTNDL